jgi:iron complex transport system substrate-binding protein
MPDLARFSGPFNPVPALTRARTGFVFFELRTLGVIAAIAAAACTGDRVRATTTAHEIVVVDDAGDTVKLAGPARRVISLIPSATETIIALGAADRLVGRTRYDVAPQVSQLPTVGGGIDPSIEAIVALRPDLVIGWDSDKRRTTRLKLAGIGIPVFSLRTQDTADVFRGIGNLGRLLSRDSTARTVIASIRTKIAGVRAAVTGLPKRRVLFVVYPNPPMTVGHDTFIGELIGAAGGTSIFSESARPWPTVAMEEIIRRNPDVIILPQGEFSANALEQFRQRPGWRDLAAVRDGHVTTVPADLTQRPGANIGDGAIALEIAIHPELKRTRAPR